MENAENRHHRFHRDGVPYFEDFEEILSHLYGNGQPNTKFIQIMMDFMRDIHHHLAHCNDILGMAEELVEHARAQSAPIDEIEKNVEICRELQKVQLELSQAVMKCTHRIIDEMFPRE